eukprot:TRINITY_DN30046_c0_g1_i1.p2 TRINITY_DN30046_c0_g1~~TRINITY_DN30046_c0_g1_i1.p2  ORF type:complete len:121 (-),score=28.53 TRINITY_DN30046_c0_g1_i1:338-646(-)
MSDEERRVARAARFGTGINDVEAPYPKRKREDQMDYHINDEYAGGGGQRFVEANQMSGGGPAMPSGGQSQPRAVYFRGGRGNSPPPQNYMGGHGSGRSQYGR